MALTSGPGLSPDQKQAIGSAGIDVLASLGDLSESIRAEDSAGARANARRAGAALDVILAACTSAGLY